MCQMPVLGAAEPLACSTLLEECVVPLWLNALVALAGWHRSLQTDFGPVSEQGSGGSQKSVQARIKGCERLQASLCARTDCPTAQHC